MVKKTATGLAAGGLVSAVLVAALPGSAGAADGVPSVGAAIAARWCAECHLVAPDQRQAMAAAPSFAAIARDHASDMAALEAFLADRPHPPMTALSLTRQEIRDLIAYIGSLR
jgi:mono/diheme cytochrome c family protein